MEERFRFINSLVIGVGRVEGGERGSAPTRPSLVEQGEGCLQMSVAYDDGPCLGREFKYFTSPSSLLDNPTRLSINLPA